MTSSLARGALVILAPVAAARHPLSAQGLRPAIRRLGSTVASGPGVLAIARR